MRLAPAPSEDVREEGGDIPEPSEVAQIEGGLEVLSSGEGGWPAALRAATVDPRLALGPGEDVVEPVKIPPTVTLMEPVSVETHGRTETMLVPVRPPEPAA